MPPLLRPLAQEWFKNKLWLKAKNSEKLRLNGRLGILIESCVTCQSVEKIVCIPKLLSNLIFNLMNEMMNLSIGKLLNQQLIEAKFKGY